MANITGAPLEADTDAYFASGAVAGYASGYASGAAGAGGANRPTGYIST